MSSYMEIIDKSIQQTTTYEELLKKSMEWNRLLIERVKQLQLENEQLKEELQKYREGI